MKERERENTCFVYRLVTIRCKMSTILSCKWPIFTINTRPSTNRGRQYHIIMVVIDSILASVHWIPSQWMMMIRITNKGKERRTSKPHMLKYMLISFWVYHAWKWHPHLKWVAFLIYLFNVQIQIKPHIALMASVGWFYTKNQQTLQKTTHFNSPSFGRSC